MGTPVENDHSVATITRAVKASPRINGTLIVLEETCLSSPSSEDRGLSWESPNVDTTSESPEGSLAQIILLEDPRQKDSVPKVQFKSPVSSWL